MWVQYSTQSRRIWSQGLQSLDGSIPSETEEGMRFVASSTCISGAPPTTTATASRHPPCTVLYIMHWYYCTWHRLTSSRLWTKGESPQESTTDRGQPPAQPAQHKLCRNFGQVPAGLDGNLPPARGILRIIRATSLTFASHSNHLHLCISLAIFFLLLRLFVFLGRLDQPGKYPRAATHSLTIGLSIESNHTFVFSDLLVPFYAPCQEYSRFCTTPAYKNPLHFFLVGRFINVQLNSTR